MVKATINNGVVNLESILEITEGQAKAIKAHEKQIKTFLKDIHCEHFISTTENGIITSTLGTSEQHEFDPITATNNLMVNHKTLIKHANSWIENDLHPELDDKDFEEDTDDEPMMIGFIPIIFI